MRPLDELRHLRKALSELRRADAAAEESARFELTQSTRHFSRKAQDVLEGTMALSATLIRAGEVDEANMLIAQVEREVHEEEAALREAMNEVEVQRVARRRKIARLRMARLLSAMVAGASMMAVSVAGIAVAGMFANRDPADTSASLGTNSEAGINRMQPRKRVNIAGVSVALTPRQLATFQNISNGGSVQTVEVQRLLTAVLPQVPVNMVDQVQTAIVSAVGSVSVPTVVRELNEAAAQILKTSKHQEEAKAKDDSTQSDEASSGQDASSPPSDDQSGGSSDDSSSSDGDSSSGSKESQDGMPGLPIPGGAAPHT